MALCLTLVATGSARTEPDPSLDLSLKASLASFYDTNIHRSYRIPKTEDADIRTRPVEEDVAMRILVHAKARGRIGDRTRVSAKYDFGAKAFARFHDEDVLLNQLQADLVHSLTGGLSLRADGLYKDKGQRGGADPETLPAGQDGQRDYRRGRAGLGLRWDLGSVVLGGRGGFRALENKPGYLHDYSFKAGHGQAGLDVPFPGQHRVGLRYEYGEIFFEGRAFKLVEEEQPKRLELPYARRDRLHRIALQYRWFGVVLVGLDYLFEVDDSNTFGESYTRHRGSFMLSAKLPGEVLLNLKGNLQYRNLTDGFSVERLLPIAEEDENQNSVLAKVGREITPWLAAEVEVKYFWNEFVGSGNAPRFERAAVAMVLAGRWE